MGWARRALSPDRVHRPPRARSQAAEQPYTAPRTPDGQPDLQGFWTNQTRTRLERPDGVTKAFYTEEEAAAIEGRAAAREGAQTEPGTIADVHYDFTQFGLDRSQLTFAQNLRTSLVVDPPNGKLPPVTAEGRRRAAEEFQLHADRIGDIFLLGEEHVAFGDLERTQEDVAIRSHGSRHGTTVPIICYGREVDASLYRRNIDLTRNFSWDA